jgi:eukaryotic-like serine/threonine-protein kinase
MSAAADSSNHDRRVDEVIAAYLEAETAGQPANRAAILARHPELASELKSFFFDHDAMRQMARSDTNSRPREADPGQAETVAPISAAKAAPGFRVRYFGDYELIDEIARGGMGVVYRARQDSLQRTVALKMILAGHLASPEDIQRFQREAMAAGNLDHPNIVPIYEVGDYEGQHYFSMKLIDGASLANRALPLPAREAAQIVATVARAVHHAHQRGILHRDLKPANILGDSNGQLFVTDFGLARRVESETRHTRTGGIVGTPSYMAPEQARSEKMPTTAVDVYSLGAILYELLTGRPPFKAATPLDTILQVLEREPERPREIDPRVDRDLEIICLKCLQKDPARRYGSAEALASDLERWLRGEPILARPIGSAERLVKWMRRRPAIAAVLATCLGIFIASLIIALWFGRLAAARARAEEARAREAMERAHEARQGAERESRLKVDALQAAKYATDAAQRARDALQVANRNLYFQQVSLAHQAWRAENPELTRRLLNRCSAESRGWEWNYLWRTCHGELLSLPGNDRYKTSIRLSRSGTRMAAISRFDLVGACVWDLTTNKLLSKIEPSKHQRRFSAGDLSPDGVTLALGEENGDVTLWEADTGKFIRFVGRLTGYVESLAFTADGKRLAGGSEDGIRMWNPDNGHPFAVPKAARKVVWFSPDGKRFLALKRNPALFHQDSRQAYVSVLFNLDSDEEERVLGVTDSAAFSPDGKLLAVAGLDPSLVHQFRVMDVATGQVKFTERDVQWHSQLAFSPDGKLLATGNPAFMGIDIWDVADGRRLHTIRGHSDWIMDFAFTPDGQLVSSSKDRTIKFWDPRMDPEVRSLPGKGARIVSDAAFRPDSAQVAFVQGDNVLGRTFLESLLGGGEGEFVTLWDPIAGKMVRRMSAHRDGARRVAYSADGTRLISGGRDKKAKVWDVRTGKLLSTFTGQAGWIEAIALSPDVSLAASAQTAPLPEDARAGSSSSKTVANAARVWDANTSIEKFTLTVDRDLVQQLAFSPDGSLLVTASGQKLRIWEASTGKLRRTIPGDKVPQLEGLSFSPDGKLLLAAGRGALTLWDPGSGEKRGELSCPAAGQFHGLSFAPDGHRVATAFGATVMLWDFASRQEILTLPISDQRDERIASKEVMALQFTPDGNRLLAAMSDGTCLYWEATPPPTTIGGN